MKKEKTGKGLLVARLPIIDKRILLPKFLLNSAILKASQTNSKLQAVLETTALDDEGDNDDNTSNSQQPCPGPAICLQLFYVLGIFNLFIVARIL